MIFNILNQIVAPLGYRFVKNKNSLADLGTKINGSNSYKLYKYVNEDGSFNYDQYKKIQEEGNKRKIENVWVLEDNIKFLSNYISKKINRPKEGICHGTRRGKEQEWFKKYLGNNVNVIGTEISETALQFPNTIQWDFHEVKPEWLRSTDFIYSNSFDHSYDPEKCINAWMSCLNKDGICILEHTEAHTADAVNELDPFGADLMIMPYLIAMWGKGKFSVREVLVAPHVNNSVSNTAFIVIQNN